MRNTGKGRNSGLQQTLFIKLKTINLAEVPKDQDLIVNSFLLRKQAKVALVKVLPTPFGGRQFF